MYRGQAKSEWDVLPRAGRKGWYLKFFNEEAKPTRDLDKFTIWRDAAVAYTDLPNNDPECLAVAQHHGLATRLLDWTTNPLIAAFFAVSTDLDSDGAVYCYIPSLHFNFHNNPNAYKPDVSIRDVERVCGYIPRSIVSRIVGQSSVFTLHPKPTEPLEVSALRMFGFDRLTKIVITAEAKVDLQQTLSRYGINYASLFPDLDGLSRHVNWQIELEAKQIELEAKRDEERK